MQIYTNSLMLNHVVTKRLLMVVVLAFFAPLTFSNYFFHDDLWMLSWSVLYSSGNHLPCGESNLFWDSYFMDGRFLSAFIADCMVKPVMNWGYGRADIYMAQSLIIGARALSLLFFSAFVWQMAKLLGRSSDSPVSALATTLAVVLLPGMVFMVLWGHAVVFNISFLFTAIFIYMFDKSLVTETYGSFLMPRLFLITMLISFLGYGLYTVSGLYIVIPVALYVGLVSKDFHWNSREERAIRTVFIGIVAATFLFIVMQKINATIFTDHVSANAKPSVSHLGGGQLLNLFGNVMHQMFDLSSSVRKMSYLWFLPQGQVSHDVAKMWSRLSGVLLHACILGSIALMFKKSSHPRVVKITINPRFFYLLVFFGLALSFIEMANAIQPRVTMVAQSIYIAMVIALIRHLSKSRKTKAFEVKFCKAPLASVFVLWLFMHWYVLNNMLLISAREEGMLSSMLYALEKGDVSSVTVRQPDMMVEPDSYGPTLTMVGHSPLGFLSYYIPPEGVGQDNIRYTTDGKGWFRFDDIKQREKSSVELFFDGREMLPRRTKWAKSKLKAADKAALLMAPPKLSVSSSAFPQYDPQNLLVGDIWHSAIKPNYPQWINLKLGKAIRGAEVALWHQPSHAERFPKLIRVRGYLHGIEIQHFSDKSLSCVPGESPSRIDLWQLGKVDSVRLEILENCGDLEHLTIGKLEVQ